MDTIHGSSIANLKELRPGAVRILFAFDPWLSSILLVAGDKAGRWNEWYAEAIPLAEQRYETYLKGDWIGSQAAPVSVVDAGRLTGRVRRVVAAVV